MKKMKKRVAIALTALSCLQLTAQAKVGDVIGSALHTDIVVYINNLAVPSYAVNGQSVIVAEDLRNFGFDVTWYQSDRTLTLSRNLEIQPRDIMFVGKGYTTGSKFTDILSTDIGVWAGGQKLTSYAMNGYTMIPVEELTMFGEVQWVQEERALKLWIDDFWVPSEKQVISYANYPSTIAPDFGWVTGTVCVAAEDGYAGRTFRSYWADANDLNKYTDYITKSGWVLDKSLESDDGRWFVAYYNRRERTGIALSESNGKVTVQITTNSNGWAYSFED